MNKMNKKLTFNVKLVFIHIGKIKFGLNPPFNERLHSPVDQIHFHRPHKRFGWTGVHNKLWPDPHARIFSLNRSFVSLSSRIRTINFKEIRSCHNTFYWL